MVKQRRERLWLVVSTSAKFELKNIPNTAAGDFEVESCIRRLLALFLLTMLAGISLQAEKWALLVGITNDYPIYKEI